MKYKARQPERHEQSNETHSMVYGYDQLEGLFVQVFDVDDELVESLTEEADKLTPQRLAQIAEDYGFFIDIGENTL
jgi:hypothetical protein